MKGRLAGLEAELAGAKVGGRTWVHDVGGGEYD